MPVRVGAKRKGRNDRKISSNGNGRNAHASHINDIGVWGMNELVELKAKEIIKIDEDYDNKYETMLMLEDWWKEEKHKYRTVALPFTDPGENTSVKIDRYTFQLIYPKDKITYTVDTDRMKRETIQVVNGETGEVIGVNAYDYFCTKPVLPKEPYVKVKVDK